MMQVLIIRLQNAVVTTTIYANLAAHVVSLQHKIKK